MGSTYCPLCRAGKTHDTCQEVQEGGPARLACEHHVYAGGCDHGRTS